MSESGQQDPEHHIVSAEFSGPLPPPVVLEQYDRIVPGAAARLLKMAEEQSMHRQQLESSVIKSDIVNSRLGLIFGFLIGTFAIFAGVFAILKGMQTAGGFVSISGIAGLTGVFVYGSRQKSKELEQKAEEMP